MPKIIHSSINSLDGLEANDVFEPTAEEHECFNQLLDNSDAIIFDEANHNLLVPYWDDIPLDVPDQPAVEREFAKIFRTTPRYVVTDSTAALEDLATPIAGDVVNAIAALRDGPGTQLMLACDADLLGRCVGQQLVDEIEVLTLPIIKGNGTSPFATIQTQLRLQLLEMRTLSSGSVLQRYAIEY